MQTRREWSPALARGTIWQARRVSSARFSRAVESIAARPPLRVWHADCLSSSIVDFELLGSLILCAAGIPYVVEVLRQTPLQARVIAALPPATRAALPPHPRHPWLTVFGSVRFFLALFRWALRDAPDDTPEIRDLKRRMRMSALREWAFGLVFLTALVLLLWSGWRPVWPRFRS